jgi:Ca2+/Na+ antiporter
MFKFLKPKTTLKKVAFGEYDNYKVEYSLKDMRKTTNLMRSNWTYSMLYFFLLVFVLLISLSVILTQQISIYENYYFIFTKIFYLIFFILLFYIHLQELNEIKKLDNEYLNIINKIEVKEIQQEFKIKEGKNV